MAKILVIDDEPAIRFIIRRMLEYAGYDVVESENAGESLEMIKKNSIDLVLMDVRMPDMSGWDAVRKIKSTKKTREIPVVVLTAGIDGHEEERTKASGADARLEKPFIRDEMLALVDFLLQKKYHLINKPSVD